LTLVSRADLNHHITNPNLRSIATACGLSHTLVSRALRGLGGVSAAKRELILKTAEDLGYRPDPLVSILLSRVRSSGRKERHQATFAWLNTNDDEGFWRSVRWANDYLQGTRKRAEALGYRLDEFWVHPEGMSAASLERVLRARNVYGIIYPLAFEPPVLAGFDWSRYATVLINWTCPGTGFSRATADGYGNLRIALKKLTELGYRRIGLYLQNGYDSTLNNDFLSSGFLFYQHLLPASERVPILDALTVFPEAQREIADWLDRHEPEVVVCHDSRVLAAICATGRRVPEDIGLIHLSVATDVEGWAGVDAHIEDITASAVDVLIGQLNRNERGMTPIPKAVTVAGEWRDGWTMRPENLKGIRIGEPTECVDVPP
jgi:LacI family transcriptional regulator